METETHSTGMHDSESEHVEKEALAETMPHAMAQTMVQTMIEKLIARLTAAVELLERAVPQAGIAAYEAVGPIVAMVEGTSREAELARKLADAEKTIVELRAQPTSREGRRTLPVSLLAKQEGSAPEPGALDAALVNLSLEQRIAVKAHLLRSGLV